jgi:NAD(P)-dependent dehydrogenase (short-subunit alcohol dehydrogenase family)
MAYDSQIDRSKTPLWDADPGQRLKGKVALVTGAGSGIGQGCALLFARHGANVFASDIDEQTAQATAAQAQAAGFPFGGVTKVDLSQEAEVRRWVADSKASAGGIDILVNAGADVACISHPMNDPGSRHPIYAWTAARLSGSQISQLDGLFSETGLG